SGPSAREPAFYLLAPDLRDECEAGGAGCKGFNSSLLWLQNETRMSTLEFLPQTTVALQTRVGELIEMHAADPCPLYCGWHGLRVGATRQAA
ncbi:hypothetical protein OAO87_04660, partial [bacterium]|nr:hypothetical protein [bacterium]